MRPWVETAPAVEPISVDTAQQWLRLDEDAADVENSLVESCIAAAREYCEHYCDRAFARQTWGVALDSLREVDLPGGQVGPVVSITYTDRDGKARILPATIYTLTRSGRLRLKPGQHWPDHQAGPDSVTITYEVGGDVPADVQMAMRLLIGHYYENRRGVVVGVSTAELPLGVEAHLARHREMSL